MKKKNNEQIHGLRTPREEIAFTARPKIHSHSQIFRYSRNIFCLPHWPNFSDIFDLCLHRVSVAHEKRQLRNLSTMLTHSLSRALTNLVKLCETSISALVLMSHYFEKNALHIPQLGEIISKVVFLFLCTCVFTFYSVLR